MKQDDIYGNEAIINAFQDAIEHEGSTISFDGKHVIVTFKENNPPTKYSFKHLATKLKKIFFKK